LSNKRQSIFEDLKTTFGLIKKASGYNVDLAYAEIGVKSFSELPADKFPALMVIGADERRENATNQTFSSSLDVYIYGYVRSSDVKDCAKLVEDLNALIADATKAIMVDPGRGCHATYSEITSVLTDKGAIQPFAMFEMVVGVDYRADFANP